MEAIVPSGFFKCPKVFDDSLPLIFRTMSHAFLIGVLLFNLEINLRQVSFLAFFMVRLASARAALYKLKFIWVGWPVNRRKVSFRCFTASLQLFVNHGLWMCLGTVEDFGMLADAIAISVWVKVATGFSIALNLALVMVFLQEF